MTKLDPIVKLIITYQQHQLAHNGCIYNHYQPHHKTIQFIM